ncbi:MAG: GDYXXLXY domain-containing protein [Desulfobacterales bacterium]|nr:GDYXXLXY domain-containing protein [Desulfobacterales bacterium]
MNPKRLLIILAILFQVVVLSIMVIEREWIVVKGQRIYLRTAPVDPRDIMRGDYVRLTYDLSHIPFDRIQGNLKNRMKQKGQIVYIVFQLGENGLATYKYATDTKPKDGLYIRGRISDLIDWRMNYSQTIMNVSYGIESYFVEQGKGRDIEQKMRGIDGIQFPMEMNIALSPSGTAVIIGHRWSPLGIGTRILNGTVGTFKENPGSITLRVTLKNDSDKPIGIVNLHDQCSFRLEPEIFCKKKYPQVYTACNTNRLLTDSDVVILKPNSVHEIDFDFSNPRWYVFEQKKAVQIGALETTELFRIVYSSPLPEQCSQLTHKDSIWHGYIASRRFHGRGNID